MGPIESLRGLRPVRNVDAGSLLESFLIWAVVSILGIRIYLELTGYPQVGGGGLHIAHMLWGGLLMLIAIVLLVAFLGKNVVRLGAILGGLGFGIFIDELGKFLTSDNNYFFRPTFALIYVIFITLFLVSRAIDRRKTLSEVEALVNAVDLLKEVVRHDLDVREKEQALSLLRQANQRDPIVISLTEMLTSTTAMANAEPPLPVRLAHWAHRRYQHMIDRRWFAKVLITIFALTAFGDLIALLVAIVAETGFGVDNPSFTVIAEQTSLGFIRWADLAASTAFAALVAIGISRLRRSRVDAYRWFRRGLLISIFFSQVFSFYSEQLLAVIGLGVNLLLLVALNYSIGEEQAEGEEAPAASRPSPVLST